MTLPSNPYLPKQYQARRLRRLSRTPRPLHPTALKFLRFVEKQPDGTLTCAARALGVSRQRAGQLRDALAPTFAIVRRQPNQIISWPCPGCGVDVRMRTANRNNRKTAYCHRCSKWAARGVTQVNVTCPDCLKVRTMSRTEHAANCASDRCHPCAVHATKGLPKRQSKGSDYCIRGHLKAENKLPSGHACKACMQERQKRLREERTTWKGEEPCKRT